MLKSDTSRRDFSGIRHTYDRTRQLRADLESLARGCLIWPDASFLHRQRCARVRATSTGTVSSTLTAAILHPANHLNRISRRGSPTLPAVRPRRHLPASTVTFRTQKTPRDFVHPWNVRTSGELRADIGWAMRSHAIERNTTFPVRQICAHPPKPRTASATQLLSATHLGGSRSSIHTPTKSPRFDPLIEPSNADRSLTRRTRNRTRFQSLSFFLAPCCSYLRSTLLSGTANGHPIAIWPRTAASIRI